ncbi:MAG: N-succinylarginine dihydrolase [Betaproteobacteria bacterium]|nr:N-succinylarginine dihydrolase [Betaproteobacteria bacterium]
MIAYEANFDGLVGPTHNYSGLSFGNIASRKNQGSVANPRLAALQGLKKMKKLADMGFKQGVLPPQERPNIAELRSLGFGGSDAEVIRAACKHAPLLYSSMLSASSMWSANAATVSPSANTADGKVHFTVANLNNKLHRSIEHTQTSRTLRAIFRDEKFFVHHDALPGCPQLGDEGAANHTRFCQHYGERGVELFVYGASGFNMAARRPKNFPARQTMEASQAIIRLHGLDEKNVVLAQQNPDVIDAGVFHNDVIAVGNGNVLFCHELAFVDQHGVMNEIGVKLGKSFVPIQVTSDEVSVEDAVESYLFNSQLLTLAGGGMLLLVPEECRTNTRVWNYLQKLVTLGTPISEVLAMDLRESMKNGGGPACLRLRVELTEKELAAVNPATLMNDALYGRLTAWVEKHYRDRIGEVELGDPALLNECRAALDELTKILALGSIYPFQRA